MGKRALLRSWISFGNWSFNTNFVPFSSFPLLSTNSLWLLSEVFFSYLWRLTVSGGIFRDDYMNSLIALSGSSVGSGHAARLEV